MPRAFNEIASFWNDGITAATLDEGPADETENDCTCKKVKRLAIKHYVLVGAILGYTATGLLATRVVASGMHDAAKATVCIIAFLVFGFISILHFKLVKLQLEHEKQIQDSQNAEHYCPVKPYIEQRSEGEASAAPGTNGRGHLDRGG